MEKIYNKLVRDNIPEIIKADGCHTVVRKLSEKRFKEEALKKVVEEAKEILEAKNKEDLIKECADMQEILETVMKVHRIKSSEVTTAKDKRKKGRGGFTKRIFLVKTVSQKLKPNS